MTFSLRISTLILVVFSFGSTTLVTAQRVLSNAGGDFSTPTLQIQQTIGEAIVGTYTNSSIQITQGFEQPSQVLVKLQLFAFLEGPFNLAQDRMNDDLRDSYLPLTEPYTALGFFHVNGGGETVNPSVFFATTNNTSVVDWVFLELRDKDNPTSVVSTRCALILQDGSVVDIDGLSDVRFQASPNEYYIAIFHRNHLAAMTLNTFALSSTTVLINLSDGSAPAYGVNGLKQLGSSYALWAGDVSNDGVIKYSGSNNDRDPILVEIGGTIPTNTSNGYLLEDVNMDGTTKYSGSNNDRDPILVNIGGSIPTNTRIEQLP